MQEVRKPGILQKIFLTHINEVFNQKIQADFMFAEKRSTKYCVLHIVDTMKGYSETSTVKKRSCGIMTLTLQTLWMHRHSAPKYSSADNEPYTKSNEKVIIWTCDHHTRAFCASA